MRSRRPAPDQVADVARRRLEQLSAELSAINAERGLGDPVVPASPVTHRHADPWAIAEPATTPIAEPAAEPTAGQAGRPAAEQDTGPSVGLPRPGRHAHRPLGLAARLGGWAHDRLPSTLQGRAVLTSSHLTVVAVVVAVALAVTAWWVIRADSGGVVVPAAAPAGVVTPAEGTADPDRSPTPVPVVPEPSQAVAEVVIDVAGKVREPGIATLPVGSRVVDALRAAGGPRRGVNLTTLNLARLLVDGEQIVVGLPPPRGVAAGAASAAPTSGAPAPLVNLNAATLADLETLPGVGPVTAQAIVDWRTEHGAFSAVEELLEVSGIGEATLADLAPFVTL